MDRIIEHIERLLLRHDCVIIPEFGGFVLQVVPAVYIGDEHSFTPARKEIIFNPTLTHNDGLLVESYMDSYSLDFDKAWPLVRKDVSAMKNILDEKSELQLGIIGLFTKENERLIFMQEKSGGVHFSTISYGFPVFHFIPLSARGYIATTPYTIAPPLTNTNVSETKTEKQSNNILYKIPVTRTFLRVVAAMAAAIILFFLISTPVNDVNNASYTASFVPQEIMPKKIADEIVSDAFSGSDNLAVVNSDNSGYVPGSPADKAEKPDAKIETSRSVDNKAEKNASEKPTNKTVNTGTTTGASKSGANNTGTKKTEPSKSTSGKAISEGAGAKTGTSTPPKTSASSKSSTAKSSATNVAGAKYYVIISSFKSKKHAQEYIKQLGKSEIAANADILVTDRARVYARSFSTEREAQSYLDVISKKPKHKDAWIYRNN